MAINSGIVFTIFDITSRFAILFVKDFHLVGNELFSVVKVESNGQGYHMDYLNFRSRLWLYDKFTASLQRGKTLPHNQRVSWVLH